MAATGLTLRLPALVMAVAALAMLAACAPAHRIEVVNATDLRVAGYWDGIRHQVHPPGETALYNFRVGSKDMRETFKHTFEARTAHGGRTVYRWEFTVAELEQAGWRIVITDQGKAARP